MINNFDDIIKAHNLLEDIRKTDEIIEIAKQFPDERPRKKIRWLLETNSNYQMIDFLSEMRVKVIRKKLLATPHDIVNDFNNQMKLKYEIRFIKNFHNKDYWIVSFLQLLKKQACHKINNIKSEIGWNHGIEMSRNHIDERILHEFSTRHPGDYGDTLWGSDYSERIRCKCRKELEGYFNQGEFYDFRKSLQYLDCKYVYFHQGLYLEFTEFSFDDYFVDRDAILDEILS